MYNDAITLELLDLLQLLSAAHLILSSHPLFVVTLVVLTFGCFLVHQFFDDFLGLTNNLRPPSQIRFNSLLQAIHFRFLSLIFEESSSSILSLLSGFGSLFLASFVKVSVAGFPRCSCRKID